MIIIGEKINGAIPSVKQAIAERNEALILERTLAQAKAGANFLDCAPSTSTEVEYDTMVWPIDLMQGCTDVPLCIDSPNASLTRRISNISFEMPARKYVNMNCMSYAIAAGLDSAIMDPCSQDMMGTIFACEALCGKDKGGRKYNRAYRQGKFGKKKIAKEI